MLDIVAADQDELAAIVDGHGIDDGKARQPPAIGGSRDGRR